MKNDLKEVEGDRDARFGETVFEERKREEHCNSSQNPSRVVVVEGSGINSVNNKTLFMLQ